MLSEECSPRTLRLTAHIISMNPAHYTVWLFRFKVLKTLALPIPEEISWLNEVALSNLKNYQIWHHRQLLMDHYYPSIEFDHDALKSLGRSEINFIQRILREDTKNYHVWSYRQYIVEKLGLWSVNELLSTQNMIEDDVRNNSAWSHRFFLVFNNPDYATPDLPPTKHDESIPTDIIERELKYAREKIELAPQNQSSWNYLRGVLAKAGRGVAGEIEFAQQFVADAEDVKSSHALDLLADAYAEQGQKDKARESWRSLAGKWDPIREGYWKWRMSQLDKA